MIAMALTTEFMTVAMALTMMIVMLTILEIMIVMCMELVGRS